MTFRNPHFSKARQIRLGVVVAPICETVVQEWPFGILSIRCYIDSGGDLPAIIATFKGAQKICLLSEAIWCRQNEHLYHEVSVSSRRNAHSNFSIAVWCRQNVHFHHEIIVSSRQNAHSKFSIGVWSRHNGRLWGQAGLAERSAGAVQTVARKATGGPEPDSCKINSMLLLICRRKNRASFFLCSPRRSLPLRSLPRLCVRERGRAAPATVGNPFGRPLPLGVHASSGRVHMHVSMCSCTQVLEFVTRKIRN